MKLRNVIILLAVSVLNSYAALAQQKNIKHYYIEPIYQYGFIWQHRPSLSEIIGGNINVARITFGQSTYGRSFWEEIYRYPDQGIGYSFTDLGNTEDLGYANAIYYYIRFPLIKRPKFSLNLKISGGLAYLNQGNIAIGSHINLYFDASVDTKVRLSDKLDLLNSFGATHYSNGAIAMPNLGVNLFSYRIGLNYKFYDAEVEKLKPEFPKILKKHAITAVAGIGIKEKRLPPESEETHSGRKYTVSSLSVDYLRIINYKHKLGVGADVFYDETMFEFIDPKSTMNLENKEIMRYGIHIAGEVRYKKLILALHVGTYLWAKYKDDGKIYQRVALRYLLSENIFANVSLKTSNGIADFVEWGIGYQFKTGRNRRTRTAASNIDEDSLPFVN